MRWAWLLALATAGILLFWLGRRPVPPPPSVSPLPDKGAFSGSAACAQCHKEEHAGWRGTAHARALRPADAATGVFDGKPVGSATPLPPRTVSVAAPRPGSYSVTHVVPGRAAEMYLTTNARGAWLLLPIAWNVGRKAWEETRAIHEALTGEEPPDDVRAVVFNRGCAPCHTTRFDTGFHFDPFEKESYASAMVEPGVGCEACHGPGSLHVRWHEEKRSGEYAAPQKLDAGGGGGACLRCHYAHEWRGAIPDEPAPFEECAVSRNFDGRGFFPDGRLSTDRHAGTTFVQSFCAKGGATCLSCHGPHGGTKASGDALCTGCHDGFARREHTFHEDVRCVDCHMPRLLGAPLEALRDHSLRSPEPLLTERFGIPNACNACHADKDVAWARAAKEKQWGPADERHLSAVATVAALRQGPVETARIEDLLRDPPAPLFFRTTALRALPAGHALVREALKATEVDLVQVACEALAERPDPLAGPALVDLLSHRARSVRVEAAHALARAGWRAAIPRPQIREDALALLGRMYPQTATLLRAGYVLEAVGSSDEAAFVLGPLLQRAPAEAAPLVQRRGRSLAEAGKHADALLVYDDARRFYGENLPGMLFIDSADSLAATGEVAAAATAWRRAAEALDPMSVASAIARARLLGAEGRGEEGRALLLPIEELLARDPLGGEALLRVRWSLDALAKR